MRILLAEDELVIQNLVSKTLRRAGYTVFAVDTGLAALQQLLDGRYDVAILDVRMPELDGIEAVRRYHLQSLDYRTPLIALTADATAETKNQCREAGFDIVLTKPARSQQVLNAIRQLLGTGNEPGPRREDSSSKYNRADRIDDVIHLETLLEWTAPGKPDALPAAVVGKFVDRAYDTVMLMSQAVINNDAIALRELIHKLHGTAGSLGMVLVEDTSLSLEKACISEDWCEVQKLIQELREALAITRRAAAKLNE